MKKKKNHKSCSTVGNTELNLQPSFHIYYLMVLYNKVFNFMWCTTPRVWIFIYILFSTPHYYLFMLHIIFSISLSKLYTTHSYKHKIAYTCFFPVCTLIWFQFQPFFFFFLLYIIYMKKSTIVIIRLNYIFNLYIFVNLNIVRLRDYSFN